MKNFEEMISTASFSGTRPDGTYTPSNYIGTNISNRRKIKFLKIQQQKKEDYILKKQRKRIRNKYERPNTFKNYLIR